MRDNCHVVTTPRVPSPLEGDREGGVKQPCRALPPLPLKGGGSRPYAAISPLVVYGKRGNVDLLTAVDAAAERLGLRAGLALAQARAMHPALVAVPEDAAADARLLDAIAEGACAIRRSLRPIRPTASCSTSAAARICSAAKQSCAPICSRASTGFGLAAHAAIATTIGTAWAAARFGEMAESRRCHHPEPADERAAIAPLPLAALRLERRDRRGAGAASD